MEIIEYPTFRNVKNISILDVYLVANDASVNKYCLDYGYTLVSYEEEEKQRFSNDGAYFYQYYTGSEWKLESGFRKVVSLLTIS